MIYKGKKPEDTYLFTSIGAGDGCITHNGVSLHPDELLVLNDNDKIDYTASGASEVLGFIVEKSFFEVAFKKHFNEPFSYDKVYKRIQLKENVSVAFRAKAKEILTALMKQGDKLKSDSLFHDKTEDDILQLIFQNIDPSQETKRTTKGEINSNEVRKYIEEHYRKNLAIEQIYFDKKLAGRRIRSGFNELFGFSPKQYLKQFRLGKVYHALLKSDSQSTTVKKVASEHGLTHMGRFSKEYRSMFGEMPYAVLKKSYPTRLMI